MTMKYLPCIAAFSLLLTPLTTKGQNASMLGPGTRVRLVTPVLEAEQRTGRLVNFNADTIQFRSDAYPVTRTFALSEITSLEVSAGRLSSKRRFALIGLALGGAVGFAAGHHNSGGHGGQVIGGGRKSPTENAFLSAGFGGAVGAATGWFIGRSRVSEKWVPVNAEGK